MIQGKKSGCQILHLKTVVLITCTIVLLHFKVNLLLSKLFVGYIYSVVKDTTFKDGTLFIPIKVDLSAHISKNVHHVVKECFGAGFFSPMLILLFSQGQMEDNILLILSRHVDFF